MKSRHLLSVDPGLSGTGVVYWCDGKPLSAHTLLPQKISNLSTYNNYDGGMALVDRARNLAKRVTAITPYPWKPHTIVIEFPEYHEGLKGRTARATGSMDRLSFFIGVLVGDLPENWVVMLPKVRDWKGQLPKDVVTRRMIKRYGVSTCVKLNVRSHAWDALGIGDWAWQQKWMNHV